MTAYAVILDGYSFPRSDIPFRGPIAEFTPQQWVKQDVIGTANPGTILTRVGTRSLEWPAFESRASTATKDKLIAVYEAGAVVLFQTPQNPTGFNVVMTDLDISYMDPIEGGRWLCRFTLVRR